MYQHYVTYGVKENRTAGSTVKVPETAAPVVTPTEPPKEDVPVFVPTVNVDYYAGEEPFVDVLKDISDMIVEYGGNGSFYTQVLKDWNITGLDTNTPGEYQITAKISGVQFEFERPDITVTVVIE